MDTGQHQQLLNPLKTKTKAETEERKQWLESIERWKQKKDAQCIIIHGTGWYYNIDTDTCVKD
jgi:hypothetical protein